MRDFPKTIAMNSIGVTGLAITGVALLFDKIGEQPIGILATIIAMYSVPVLVAAGTGFALARENCHTLRRGMLWANWTLIGLLVVVFAGWTFLGGLAMVGVYFWGAVTGLGPAILFFGVPGWVNIRALRSALASAPGG
jgi:hypothetical protein